MKGDRFNFTTCHLALLQINARTELALRYNDISPLENHHCSVAFRILELQECNILASLPAHVFRTVREGIIRCILATDMARHNEILAQFKDITPEFDFANKSHTDLVRSNGDQAFSVPFLIFPRFAGIFSRHRGCPEGPDCGALAQNGP